MMERAEREKVYCRVCGAKINEGKLCDCCRDSLALCDIEEYVEKKEKGKICERGEQTLSNKTGLW